MARERTLPYIARRRASAPSQCLPCISARCSRRHPGNRQHLPLHSWHAAWRGRCRRALSLPHILRCGRRQCVRGRGGAPQSRHASCHTFRAGAALYCPYACVARLRVYPRQPLLAHIITRCSYRAVQRSHCHTLRTALIPHSGRLGHCHREGSGWLGAGSEYVK